MRRGKERSGGEKRREEMREMEKRRGGVSGVGACLHEWGWAVVLSVIGNR